MEPQSELFTIGHSTHPADRFVALLRRYRVELLCDVRRFPGSRRNPQFNVGVLRESLTAGGIAYELFGDELGGRRKASKVPHGPSAGWRNDAFRGYAEYMETREFADGVERLEALARERRTAIVCAEGDWHRCHRRLIADALTRRAWHVIHIRPDGRTEEHQATLTAPEGFGSSGTP